MGRQFPILLRLRNLSTVTMRFLSLLLCASLAAGNIVKREATAEAEAEAFIHGRHHGVVAYHHAPVPRCTLTPVRDCKPRKVETPRKVCQQVADIHKDTVVTEDCKEVTTTVCTQTTTVTQHTSTVVDTNSELVEKGEPKPAESLTHNEVTFRHWKREAEAEADPSYSEIHLTHHSSVPLRNVSPADCKSTPEKTCEKNPVEHTRKVFRTVCDTVVDVTNIEDCTETVTRNCVSESTSSHTSITGHERKVV